MSFGRRAGDELSSSDQRAAGRVDCGACTRIEAILRDIQNRIEALAILVEELSRDVRWQKSAANPSTPAQVGSATDRGSRPRERHSAEAVTISPTPSASRGDLDTPTSLDPPAAPPESQPIRAMPETVHQAPAFPARPPDLLERLQGGVRVAFYELAGQYQETSGDADHLIYPENAALCMIPTTEFLRDEQHYHQSFQRGFDCVNPSRGYLLVKKPARVRPTDAGRFVVEEKGEISVD